MSDILKEYFDNFSRYKNRAFKSNKKKNPILSQDLSNYGIFVSENNILTFTPVKNFSVMRKYNSKKNKLFKGNFFSSLSEKNSNKYNITKIIPDNDNENNEISGKIKNQNIFLNGNKLKLENYIRQKNTLLPNYKNSLNYLKKNNIFNYNKNLSENINNIKNNIMIPYLKNIKNLKDIKNRKNNNNDNKKSILKKKKEEEDKEIDLIIEKLMRKKNRLRQCSEYKSEFSFSNFPPKESTINPMNYIQKNLLENPNEPNLYKSYKEQLDALGNKNYRKLLLEGINAYNLDIAQYKNLKGPTGLVKKENKNIIQNKINDMFRTQKKFSFNKDIKHKKNKIAKNIKTFSFESKTNNNNFDNKRIVNINLRLNAHNVNDIEKLNKFIDDNNKLLSFDRKLDLFLLSAQKTSNYINKRSEEYNKINNIIFEATA